MVGQPTESLVNRYLNQPGVEGEQLEFKAKEKIETSEQRRELVKILTAMANTHGGTVIVGVGRGKRDDIIQSFDNQSELKRDLYQTARDNTEPTITDLLDVNFDEIPPGATILRIDVDRAHTHPIKVDIGGSNGFTAYRRVGDTTKPMTVDDGVQFAEDRFADRRSESLVRTEHVSVDSVSMDRGSFPNAPAQRVISNIKEDYQIVFGSGIEFRGYESAVVFDIEATVGGNCIDDLDMLKSILNAAKEYLDVNLGRELGYSIKQGTRTQMGKHVDHFFEDLRQLEGVVTNMLGGHPQDVSDDVTHIDSVRPTVVAYSNSRWGTFWLKLEWREHLQQFIRPKCGVILGELPFDDDPLRSFFSAIDGNPHMYKQNTGLQKLTLKGQILLQTPQPVQLEPTNELVGHVFVSNPFYNQAEILQQQVEAPLPRHFVEGICSITHLPVFNHGPELDDDDKVWLRYLDMTHHRLTWPTFFLDAVCSPE